MKYLVAFALLITVALFSKANNVNFIKAPIVVEAITQHTTVEEALKAAKAILLSEKFIIEGEMGKNSFTAKRTTNARADYYVADVAAEIKNGKAAVTITFVKVGTGLLKLQKIADSVKAQLEK